MFVGLCVCVKEREGDGAFVRACVSYSREFSSVRVAVKCSAKECVAVCCSLLQCAAVRCTALQCVAVCCSVLQCVAVCCSALQCVVLPFHAVIGSIELVSSD